MVVSHMVLLRDVRYALALSPRLDKRTQMIRYKGTHCPKDITLMGVR